MPKKSDVWQHFTRVTDDHGKFIHKGECKYCRKVLKTKDGTANMWKHLRKFHPLEAAAVTAVGFGAAPPPQQQPPLPPPSSCTTSTGNGSMWEETSKHLARMIALHGHASLSPEFRVPSRVDIEEMCDGILDEARRDLFDRLRRVPCFVMASFAVGKAKTLEYHCATFGGRYTVPFKEFLTRDIPLQICLQELLNVRKVLLSELDKVTRDDAIYYKEFTWVFQKDVADVLKEAKDCLDKAIQDSYLIWSMPLVLDPRYKLRFYLDNFSDAFGPEVAANYFSQVTSKLEKLYTDYAEDGRASAMTIVSSDPLQQPASDEYRLAEAQTELSRYLNNPLVEATKGFDILNWWKDSSQSYPIVARMARDALAMPASSKLSSDQIAHVRSMVGGYSNAAFGDVPF
uniref:Os12g0204000 protein n=1 Tax=Saccharum spontaneum TaxID=62335 RepID=A0A678TQE6_SACSP|nr:Os12g0204000 protein [Saccharum spontaneum]